MPASNLHVLFVCTGNTCRSPMAEGLFSAAAAKLGNVEAESAGIAAMPGAFASSETLEILHERGLNLDGFRSRMVDEELLSKVTHVFCMTQGHLETLEMRYPEFRGKFNLVCDFAEIDGQVGRDIPDPIGQGLGAYREVANCLDSALAGIVGFLEAERRRESE